MSSQEASETSLVKAPWQALGPVLLSYVLAAGAGYALLSVLSFHPLLNVLLADVLATVVMFAFSRAYNNSSFYDPYWSAAPPLLMIAWWAVPADHPRSLLAFALIMAWAVRLTNNWLRSWEGFGHEDWRYVEFRGAWKGAYWIGSFFAIHLFPTLMTYLGSLPLYYVGIMRTPLHALDVVAALVTLAAVVIEALSDAQLRNYRKSGGAGDICDVGLWRYSRHPNYFGECLFWLGLFLFGLAANPGALWSAVGFLAIVAMFVFGTIPMMERRSLKRRPHYAEVQKRVSMLVPLPPR